MIQQVINNEMIRYAWWIDDTVLTSNLDWHDITNYRLMPTAGPTETQSESLAKLLFQICKIHPPEAKYL